MAIQHDAPWKQQLPLRIVGEPKAEKLLTPYGAIPPWHTMEFGDPNTELSWLIQTSLKGNEIPSLRDEALANGFSVSDSQRIERDDDYESSSYLDIEDGDPDATLAETELNAARMRRIPFEPDPVELAARQRQYDFDQFLQNCSQTVKMHLTLDSAGNILTESNDARHKNKDGSVTPEYEALEARLVERLGTLPDAEELSARLARAEHYKALVWAEMTPDQQQAWIERRPEIEEYLNPEASVTTIEAWQTKVMEQDLLALVLEPDPDEEKAVITATAPDPRPEGAPVELNLHFVTADLDQDDPVAPFYGAPVALPEPTAFELWGETQTQDAPDPLRTEAFHRLLHRIRFAGLRKTS